MIELEELKALLSGPSQRIRLHEHVAKGTVELLETFETDQFSLQAPMNDDLFRDRLSSYEEVLKTLLAAEMLLGRWSTAEQLNTAILPIRRAGLAIKPINNGLNSLLLARWYPTSLLLYAGGIGAIAAENYDLFKRLLHANVSNPYGHRRRDIAVTASSAAMIDLGPSFRVFQDVGNTTTPRSDHLSSVLESSANEILHLGPEYEDTFDRFEMLLALEYMHIDHPDPVDGKTANQLRAPIGRFVWKYKAQTTPLSTLRDEAKSAESDWRPLKAGLFGGSTTRFIELAEALSIMSSRYF